MSKIIMKFTAMLPLLIMWLASLDIVKINSAHNLILKPIARLGTETAYILGRKDSLSCIVENTLKRHDYTTKTI